MVTTLLGVPVCGDPWWPAAEASIALIGSSRECDIYLGSEYRVDVSSEAGSRFDQNITGFCSEELFGFNAELCVRTGRFQKVLGL